MNCQSCNTEIDYRFLTNCAHCGCEVTGASLTLPAPLPPASGLNWKQRLVNVAYVLVTSGVGMISGAVVVYFCAAKVYLAFFSASDPSVGCAQGMAVGLLSIMSGAFLGTVGGSIFAVKRPLCKSTAR